MSSSLTSSRAPHLARSSLLGALVVLAAITGVAGCRMTAGSSAEASPRSLAAPSTQASQERLSADAPGNPPGPGQGDRDGALDVADGELPEGVTVFDGEYPAVAKLDPALLAALRRAAEYAAGDGVELYVNSGWRSPAHQRELLDDAIATYGSSAKAARWVATPATSPHVSGDAADIGRSDAWSWLSRHGAEYGLCQIYRNEPWHYELRPEAVHHGCPPVYADPTQDPRMLQ